MCCVIVLARNTPHSDPLPQGAKELSLPRLSWAKSKEWEGLREGGIFQKDKFYQGFYNPLHRSTELTTKSPFGKGDFAALQYSV